MNTIVIIQARMTSSRLPGKVMMEVKDVPMIEHVLNRAKRIKADGVVLAVPAGAASVPLVRHASQMNVNVFQGSEHDVLERYHSAARVFNADIIVRITADCPLLDPDVCNAIVTLRRTSSAEYAANVWPRSFPKGLDCEVFTRHILNRAHLSATEKYDREHVTPWIARETYRVNYPSGRFDLAMRRWTVDYPEDLEFVREVYKHLDLDVEPNPYAMEHVLKVLEDDKRIEKINAKVKE